MAETEAQARRPGSPSQPIPALAQNNLAQASDAEMPNALAILVSGVPCDLLNLLHHQPFHLTWFEEFCSYKQMVLMGSTL
jgi:hypothetical protein